ncbi:hypothetical protein GM418_16570 [Maribellus comscasis]|uniref:Uncharacterized protein n=1 Tax=Maribellus comscasis TaxID=2681766 RepID=A0A6I6JQH1_9BACT|nr:hypothetical protein [Maribellus comscasis]QGY45226.1 hypothetical protein GM418_16570 [Maribellus comscasis]
MNRRDFLHYTGAASLITTGIISPATLMATHPFPGFSGFQELVDNLVLLNDEQVEKIAAQQNLDKSSKYYGGVYDTWKIVTPHSAGGLFKTLAIAYSQPKSKYYLDNSLLGKMEMAVKYLLKVQHSDGTIDLLSTNFHSTPDTGFVVEPLCASYDLLKKLQFPRKESLLRPLELFLKNAGEAFVVGGIHTPNHRWVVSMALARLNTLFPDERYLKRIDQWLQEGVDIDADGQYEERSTYIYTPLTNRCLIYISLLAGRPELMDIVRKNLEMTLYYVHPNGEVATEASGRQDQFRVGFMEHYYIPYRMAALTFADGCFSAMVSQIESTVPEKLLTYLPYFLTTKELGEELPAQDELPRNYVKEFKYSNLVRIRRGNIDATILGDNPTFFTLSKGKAVLASVRLASAFFGRGQFRSEKINRTKDGLELNWSFDWGYFQPLPKGEKPNYEIPFDEDRKRREKSEVQHLKMKVVVSENQGIFTLDFDLEGTENVPLAIELAFRNEGTLQGGEKVSEAEDVFLLRAKNGFYQFKDDIIKFGPGNAAHEWTEIRGALPRPNGKCVYLTGFTPFKKQIFFQ